MRIMSSNAVYPKDGKGALPPFYVSLMDTVPHTRIIVPFICVTHSMSVSHFYSCDWEFFSRTNMWRVITRPRPRPRVDCPTESPIDVLIQKLTSSITQSLLLLLSTSIPLPPNIVVWIALEKKLILLNHQIPLKINRVLADDHHRTKDTHSQRITPQLVVAAGPHNVLFCDSERFPSKQIIMIVQN